MVGSLNSYVYAFNFERMNALIKDRDSLLKLTDLPKPLVHKDDDVLIQVKATGICGTDIHILRGEYPAKSGIILGHESSGIVEEIGRRVKNVKVGDRVILDPTYHCGTCSYCQSDRPNYCVEKSHTETGVSKDGTFAEYHVTPANFLHHLPDEMSFETATLTEPLACVLNGLKQARIAPGSRVLVTGAGPMGLLFGLAASSLSCEVTVGDVSDYRVKQAQFLFSDVQNYSTQDILSQNKERKFDMAIDASGKSLEDLLQLMAKGGKILTAGLDYSHEARIKPSYLTDNGLSIIGSIDSNLTFEPAIKMLKTNPTFRKIITHTFPITDYKQAFQVLGLDLTTMQRRDINAGKVVILPS